MCNVCGRVVCARTFGLLTLAKHARRAGDVYSAPVVGNFNTIVNFFFGDSSARVASRGSFCG